MRLVVRRFDRSCSTSSPRARPSRSMASGRSMRSWRRIRWLCRRSSPPRERWQVPPRRSARPTSGCWTTSPESCRPGSGQATSSLERPTACMIAVCRPKARPGICGDKRRPSSGSWAPRPRSRRRLQGHNHHRPKGLWRDSPMTCKARKRGSRFCRPSSHERKGLPRTDGVRSKSGTVAPRSCGASWLRSGADPTNSSACCCVSNMGLDVRVG
mmetsp:Transcript_22133/g.62059  ORF Transcript_22133/g.62059 Transcript_22133/m.62059 type:complete len:213 (+) Transcript_22133:237-875(+)